MDTDVIEKRRLELRQQLKSQLLTLSPSVHSFDRFHRFIPNARDNEFLEKQGLDCVINYLLNDLIDFNEQSPLICSNCRCDSTENWWFSMDNRSIYLCDQCEETRMRRTLLQQHRESMKSAFLQAKESEQRLRENH